MVTNTFMINIEIYENKIKEKYFVSDRRIVFNNDETI